MKDRFFAFLDRIYELIYQIVVNITYKFYGYRSGLRMAGISMNDKKEIRKYWKKITGHRINTVEYRLYQNIGEIPDPRIIPDSVFHAKIEPYFNNVHMTRGFSDKNYMDLILGKEYTPRTIIRCINGEILDSDYLPTDVDRIQDILPEEMICKPSIDSGGGRGIRFIKKTEMSSALLTELEKDYNGNYIIQDILKQHPFFAQFNACSVNTIRVISLIYENKVRILSASLRVGGNGNRIDNVSSGGVSVLIDENWRLKNRLLTMDKKTQALSLQMSSLPEIPVDGMQIPGFEKIVDCISRLHYRLAHIKLIGWDVVLDEAGCVRIVEYNLKDGSVFPHQQHDRPLFGDKTEEILKKIFNGKQNGK